jgi:serine/threonine protein kinase
MGVVYRAIDMQLGRPVALKILRDDLRAQQHIVARFQREAEAIATLNHPNIVHVYSVGSVGKIPYLAMEFIEGTTLGAC